ncbi:MAG: hypothetical protein Q7S16_04415 [bacterium]|nr:hypothetical protein [bacterium]
MYYKHLKLTFAERLIAIAVLSVTLQFSFPQFSHAAVPVPVRPSADFSSAFVIALMQSRSEVIEPALDPIVIADARTDDTTLPAMKAHRSLWVLVTAYSSTPEETDGSPYITASNTFVRDGVVAANFLSFHTRLRIPQHFGDTEFVVEDRMNERFSNRIDIWMSSKAEARKWGARFVKVEIL